MSLTRARGTIPSLSSECLLRPARRCRRRQETNADSLTSAIEGELASAQSASEAREAKMLKVVGAGVGRTGTHSLKNGLEILLGGTCHHMIEVIFVHPEEKGVW